jgi:hypothetical protein
MQRKGLGTALWEAERDGGYNGRGVFRKVGKIEQTFCLWNPKFDESAPHPCGRLVAVTRITRTPELGEQSPELRIDSHHLDQSAQFDRR